MREECQFQQELNSQREGIQALTQQLEQQRQEPGIAQEVFEIRQDLASRREEMQALTLQLQTHSQEKEGAFRQELDSQREEIQALRLLLGTRDECKLEEKLTCQRQDVLALRHQAESHHRSPSAVREGCDSRHESSHLREEIKALRLQLDFAKNHWELTESLAKESMRCAHNLCSSLMGDLEQRLRDMVGTEIQNAVARFESVQMDAVLQALQTEGALLESTVTEAVANAIKMQSEAIVHELEQTRAAVLACRGRECPVQLEAFASNQRARHLCLANADQCSEGKTDSDVLPSKCTEEDSLALQTPRKVCATTGREGSSAWPFAGVLEAVWAIPEPRGHPPSTC